MNLAQLVWLFFGFSGRVSRAAYFLAAMLLTVVLSFLLYRTVVAQQVGASVELWDLLLSIAVFVSLWAQAALGVKRIHDIGRSGIFAIALFLPALNIIAFIALCLIPGESAPNRYGQITNAPNRVGGPS